VVASAADMTRILRQNLCFLPYHHHHLRLIPFFLGVGKSDFDFLIEDQRKLPAATLSSRAAPITHPSDRDYKYRSPVIQPTQIPPVPSCGSLSRFAYIFEAQLSIFRLHTRTSCRPSQLNKIISTLRSLLPLPQLVNRLHCVQSTFHQVRMIPMPVRINDKL
jgi:hypothetical protein